LAPYQELKRFLRYRSKMAVPLPGVSEGPAKPLTYICCSLNQGCPHINPTWFIGRASSWEEVQISLQRSGRDKAQSLLNCSPGSNGGCSADSSAGKTGKPRRERMNEGRSLQRYAAIWVLAASLPERKTTCKNGGGVVNLKCTHGVPSGSCFRHCWPCPPRFPGGLRGRMWLRNRSQDEWLVLNIAFLPQLKCVKLYLCRSQHASQLPGRRERSLRLHAEV